MMIEGYKSILAYHEKSDNISISVAHNCEQAYYLVKKHDPFDIIFLDLNLPSFVERNISSGKELALVIKKYTPQSKIVILTSHAESIILYDIIKKVNPEGLMVKSDITPLEFLSAFDRIDIGDNYYSSTVKKLLQNLFTNNLYLDNYNRQIILLIAQGIKTKNLPQYLPLSISAIDKRKAQIKEYFNLSKGNDEDILRAAKEVGLI